MYQVESGVSKAAKLARLIPRTNSWAVSGTPLKKNIDDLQGLLIFLGFEPFASSKTSWQRVDKATLRQIVSSIALRHNKHKVAHELRLPPQRRAVITMPFTAIEEQNYDQLFLNMCESLRLNVDGSPNLGEWDPDNYVESMRSWLKRLRETCLHPQVGAQNRRALGRGNGPLRTVDEVLNIMIEQNQSELRTQERAMILAQVLRGQIINNDKSNEARSEDALKVYQDALLKAEAIVQDCRDECAAEEARLKDARIAKMAIDDAPSDVEDDESDDPDANDAKRDKKGSAAPKRQLRSALEALHVCLFYVGTAYYQMKEKERVLPPSEDATESVNTSNHDHDMSLPHESSGTPKQTAQAPKTEDEVSQTEQFHQLEKLEVQYYDRAKAVRNELLLSARKRAMKAIGKVRTIEQSDKSKSAIETIPILDDSGGIEARNILAKFDSTSTVLDAQAEMINKWRNKIIQILTGPLVDVEDDQEITGEEYEDSTKLQDELYVYITGLLAVLADRQQCVSGEKNFLQDFELKQALKAAKDGKGHAPELLLKIVEERKKGIMGTDISPLQAIISEARSVASSLASAHAASRSAIEASILEDQLDNMRHVMSKQREIIKVLEKDQIIFHDCMNQRVAFYAALQVSVCHGTSSQHKTLQVLVINLEHQSGCRLL